MKIALLILVMSTQSIGAVGGDTFIEGTNVASGLNVYSPHVTYYKGQYLMWYGGSESIADYPNDRIYYKTSPDNVNWSRPVEVLNPRTISPNGVHVNDPSVAIDINQVTGLPQFTMAYTYTESANEQSKTQIWTSVSADGVHWNNHQPLLNSPLGPAEPSFITHPENGAGTLWKIYYVDRMDPTRVKMARVFANRTASSSQTVFTRAQSQVISSVDVKFFNNKWQLFFNVFQAGSSASILAGVDLYKVVSDQSDSWSSNTEVSVFAALPSKDPNICGIITPSILPTSSGAYDLFFGIVPRNGKAHCELANLPAVIRYRLQPAAPAGAPVSAPPPRASLLLWNNDTGHISAGYSSGTGLSGFSALGAFGVLSPNKFQIFFADVNGDAKEDLLFWNKDTGHISAGYSSGTGLSGFSALGAFGVLSPNKFQIFFADVNGDAKEDLLFWNKDTGHISAGYSSGTGLSGFTASGAFGVLSPNKFQIFFADVNGDAKEDLLFWNKDTGHISAGYSSGTGLSGFSASGAFGVLSPNKFQIFFADVNGDAKEDLLFWNKDTGHISAGYSSGTGLSGFTASGAFGVLSPNKFQIFFADVNGDGKKDLLFWNKDSGYISAGYSSGTGLSGFSASGAFGVLSPNKFQIFFADVK